VPRIEEPTRYCIGFLRKETEEENRGGTGQRQLKDLRGLVHILSQNQFSSHLTEIIN